MRRAPIIIGSVAIGTMVSLGVLSITSTSSPPETRVFDLYVADHTEPCTGVGPMTCLLVREDPNAEWTYHYSGIEGFEYEPGYFYHLRIEETPVKNPPADASSLSWRLIEVIEKRPAN